MKKSYLLAFFFLFSFFQFSEVAFAGEAVYSYIKISNPTSNTIQEIRRLGISLEGSYLRKNVFLFLTVNNIEKKMLTSRGIKFTLVIGDLEEYYEGRLVGEKIQSTGKGFDYGSMGGFYTFKEVEENLNLMAQTYPNLVSLKQSIGKSHEDRDIWMVKISDNPNINEDEPEALYTAIHHAREPEGMMALLYYMWHLLENYNKDSEATYLINERELYFVPVVNPDGYVYNETKKPNGGGMWRKNTYKVDSKLYGVDLNRNYGFKWGHDNNGSSNNPGSDTYRGPSAFSEPETESIRELCKKHKFTSALNYHTYSNLLIYPFGYNDQETPHANIFRMYAKDMTKFNHYEHGTGMQTVGYMVNGDSDDWMYGEQNEKPMMISMTPEVGGWNDGFWPQKSRIIPLAEENLFPNKYLAHVSGAKVILKDKKILPSEFVNAGDEVKLILYFENVGLATAEQIKVSLLTKNLYTIIDDNESNLFSLKSFESASNENDPIVVKINDNLPSGTSIKIEVTIDYGFKYQETLELTVGSPNVIFESTGDDGLNAWNKSNWGVVKDNENNYFTDSPQGNYQSNADNSLAIHESFDLSGYKKVWLAFDTKWDIEKDYDFGQIEYSFDEKNWVALAGKYTKNGSGFGKQKRGQPGFHETQNEFVKEEINLNLLIGNPKIFIRFHFASDDVSNRDGWSIDNVKIEGIK